MSTNIYGYTSKFITIIQYIVKVHARFSVPQQNVQHKLQVQYTVHLNSMFCVPGVVQSVKMETCKGMLSTFVRWFRTC